MKRIILLLLISVFFLPLLAEEKNIKLLKKTNTKEARSIVYIPSVTYDNNIIRIFSDIPLENLQVTISDYMGNVVYSSTIILSPNQHYLIDTENGEYIIELEDGKNSYYGYFEVTQ